MGYNDSYVSNGRKWSNSDSDQSGSGKYKPLRDSANYPTLKAMEWDHAVVMGGFGESSTDYTLRPKKKGNSQTVETPLNTPEDCRMSLDLANGIDNPSFEQEKEKRKALRSADLYKKRMMDDRNSTDGCLTDQYSVDSQSLGTIDDEMIQRWKDEINDDLVTKENSHLFETRVPIVADAQSMSDGSDSIKKCPVLFDGSISPSEDSCIVEFDKPDGCEVVEPAIKSVCSLSISDGERTGNSSTPIIEPPDNFKDSNTNLGLVDSCGHLPEETDIIPPKDVDIAPPEEVIIVRAESDEPTPDDDCTCVVEDTSTLPCVHDLKEHYESLLRPRRDDRVRARCSPRRNTFTGSPTGQPPAWKARSIEDITSSSSELERVLKRARRNTFSGELDDDDLPIAKSQSTDCINDLDFNTDDIQKSIEKLNRINDADMIQTDGFSVPSPVVVVAPSVSTSHDGSCEVAPPRANNDADIAITLPSNGSPWNTTHSNDGQKPLARVKPQIASM